MNLILTCLECAKQNECNNFCYMDCWLSSCNFETWVFLIRALLCTNLFLQGEMLSQRCSLFVVSLVMYTANTVSKHNPSLLLKPLSTEGGGGKGVNRFPEQQSAQLGGSCSEETCEGRRKLYGNIRLAL